MAKMIFNALQGSILHDDDEFKFSYFNSVRDTSSQQITLAEFIDMLKQPSDIINNIRATTDKKIRDTLKGSLPGVTISGVFNGGRKESDLESHSRLLCMDFDAADNPCIIEHESEWRDRLINDKYVRVSFITASGHGLATITEISPQNHLRAFKALEAYFKKEYGLVADKACKDIPRFRFMSSDVNVRVNPNAVIFQKYSLADEVKEQEIDFDAKGMTTEEQQELPKQNMVNVDTSGLVIPQSRKQEIASALEYLCPNNRQEWLEIGMAIKSESSHMSAFNLWREWSMLNDTANKYNENDLARVWKSFGVRENGITIATLFKKAKEHGWKNQQVEMSKNVPVVTASSYLINTPPERNFIVEGLIEENDYIELIAPSKCRKTFFAIYLGLCIASGTPFLNWDISSRRRVLYVNLEIKTANLHRRISRMCKAMNLSAENIDNFYAMNLRGVELTSPLDSICKVIKDLRPSFTIVDPMYLVHNEAENDQQAMTQVVKKFTQAIEDFHTTILVVHHDAKGTAGDRNNRDRGSGSGVLMRISDLRIIMTPHADDPANSSVVEIVGREIPPSDGTVVSFEDGAFVCRDDMSATKETTLQGAKQQPRIDYQTLKETIINKLIEDIHNSKCGIDTKGLRYLITNYGLTNRNKQSDLMQELRMRIDFNDGEYAGITYELQRGGNNLFIYKRKETL